jgi:hypothetical protein
VPSHSRPPPPRVRGHLSEVMRIATVRHTKMAEQLATLRAVVSSTAESVLRCSPTKAFRVNVVEEMLAEF